MVGVHLLAAHIGSCTASTHTAYFAAHHTSQQQPVTVMIDAESGYHLSKPWHWLERVLIMLRYNSRHPTLHLWT